MQVSAMPNVRDWSIQQNTQPSVRVGIILEQDRHCAVRIDIAGMLYRILVDEHEHAQLVGATAGASLQAGKLVLTVGQEDIVAHGSIRFEPVVSETLSPASVIVHGVIVHDVIAGRGFHWQQRCNQTLAGTVEIRPGNHGMVLINELPLETYLTGVITAEMSGDCPVEFLKAQCVVARSWLLAMTESKHDPDPFDRCNDDCCQRYQGVANTSEAAQQAVDETVGLILRGDPGYVVDAVYSKCCAGITELPESVWGQTKPSVESVIDATQSQPIHRHQPITNQNFEAYLRAGDTLAPVVYCSPHFVPVELHARYLGHVDEPNDYYRWSVTQSRGQVEGVLKQHVPELNDLTRLDNLEVIERGVSGRAQSLRVDWTDHQNDSHETTITSEYNIRQALHADFLYSSAFSIEINRHESEEIESITLHGLGWGHGAGLCQMGALGMGLVGKQHAEILSQYFPSAALIRAYP